MSMQHYAFTGYGVVLNGLADEELLSELADAGRIEAQYSFTGEAFPLKDDGTEDWGRGRPFDGETVYFVPLPKYPSLFKAAYPNMVALATDMQLAYDRVEGLPKATVANLGIVSIQGSYFG